MTAPTPCSEPNPCEDGEPCAVHEEEQAHAAGEHEFCGVTCEVQMPTEPMRNFVIARGYPGTAGALDELLRRARAAGRAEGIREAAGALEAQARDICAYGEETNLATVDECADRLRRMAGETAPRPAPAEPALQTDAARNDYAAKVLYQAATHLADIKASGRYGEGINAAATLLRTWADQCRHRAAFPTQEPTT